MKNIIQKIQAGEDLEKIFDFSINNIFTKGPIEVSDLEIITYICIYHSVLFEKYLDKVLNVMGLFYKENFKVNSLEDVVFGQYRKHIFKIHDNYYTPVQSQILHRIDNQKCYSFSAPTSTGKSFVFMKKIKQSKNDVVIVVPSRALINEYLVKLQSLIIDKTINILTFIDKINTKNVKKNIFIVTPERCRELFRLKNEFQIDLFLFDEAQLSNEDSTRGLLFDGIVRRCYKNFQSATFVFAHPFVKNPEAQLKKNNLEFDKINYKQFTQKNVGQIFFFHDTKEETFNHFGLDKRLLGKNKIKSSFDPIEKVLLNKGSVLFYVSKSSIRNNTIFTDFAKYLELCPEYENFEIKEYLDDLIEYTGGALEINKDYYSKLINSLKRGIVIHHGSLPLKIRSVLEKYTNAGFCRLCFATSTLEQGVNMPFDLVYLNRLEVSKPLSVKNLIGRAGRSTSEYKFDYGFVVVKNLSGFRKVMNNEEVMDEISLLDINEDDKDDYYNDFKDAILNESFDDELNLTDNQVKKLSTKEVFDMVSALLEIIFENGSIISLESLNNSLDNKLELYGKFESIYANYLGRELVDGERYVFNTAIKIILWRVHGKTFKKICWFRYSHASQTKQRRMINFNSSNSLKATFFTECPSDFPNKNLKAYSALNNVLAKDVDYDFIMSDTYDYIDKLIGFKLVDVFFATLVKYNDAFQDSRAIKLSKYIKYGTDNERHILMLRYGLTFEDIDVLDDYIESISEFEVVIKESIYNLPDRLIQPLKRYI